MDREGRGAIVNEPIMQVATIASPKDQAGLCRPSWRLHCRLGNAQSLCSVIILHLITG